MREQQQAALPGNSQLIHMTPHAESALYQYGTNQTLFLNLEEEQFHFFELTVVYREKRKKKVS